MAGKAGPRQLMRSFMYRHTHRRGSRKPAMVVVLVALLVLALAMMLRSTVVFRAGTAAADNLIVFGTVYDSNGIAVEGADVNVTVIGSIVPSPYQLTASIVGGFYTVTFVSTDWQIGDTVKVVASFGGESGENQTTAASENLEIDAHLVAAIPELDGPASVMLTVGGTAALVLLVARRRR